MDSVVGEDHHRHCEELQHEDVPDVDFRRERHSEGHEVKKQFVGQVGDEGLVTPHWELGICAQVPWLY